MKVRIAQNSFLFISLSKHFSQKAAKLLEEDDDATPETDSTDISLEASGSGYSPSTMLVNGVARKT